MVQFKLPVREVLTAIPETLNAFYHSYKEYEKISKFKKTRVIYCEKSGLVDGLDTPIYGDINTEKNMIKIRGTNTVHFIAYLGYSRKSGEYVAVIPEHHYETLDFDKISEFQKLEILTKEKKPMTQDQIQKVLNECAAIQEFKTFKPELSLNFTVDTQAMQNQESLDFSRYSENIATSNAYKLLYTTPNKILILIGLLALFGGMAIGGVLMFMGYAALTLIKMLVAGM